ncbi:MAG TPA: NAD-dependent epimerase/dehydratase family protein [Dehalococcoidia bacterium]|nr:NAD-dependent epimerase/dehydratase family protein [Dehalococcoidia bacterium]
MKVGVTGGSGFIGSHVVDALLEAGHQVRVLDLRHPHRPEAEFRPVDVLDGEALAEAVAGLDALFHLAAVADVNDVDRDPARAVAINVLGTAHALLACLRAGVGRFLLASTVWVYSSLAEGVEAPVDEDAPFSVAAGRHVYTSTKLAAEMLCHDFQRQHGLPCTVLRYGIPYGPRMRPSLVIPTFVRRALRGEPLLVAGDGSQSRRFLYVGDLARAHVLALSSQAAGRTYNLDGEEEVTILRLAQTVLRLTGSRSRIEFVPARGGDYRGVPVSSERAQQDLGWRPQVPFEEGMARTVAWLRHQEGLAAARQP